MDREPGRLRLAEPVAAISLATDLGTGQPSEHALRTCLLSLRVASELGLSPAERSVVYYTALLRFLGCTADAAGLAEEAGGDDLTAIAGFANVFMGGTPEMLSHIVRRFASDQRGVRRARLVFAALTDPRAAQRTIEQHCEVGGRLAARIGVAPGVGAALAAAFERWDGKGFPNRIAGEDIPLASRIVIVCRDAEMFRHAAGTEAALEIIASRKGRAYDPTVSGLVPGLVGDVEGSAFDQVLAEEPTPVATVPEGKLAEVLEAFADFADLKSPWTRGHSRGVAALAASAARTAGLTDEAAASVRRAGLVHDLGRVGVANGIWDKPGPLTDTEWERVRLHPYLTERIVARCNALAGFAEIACAHHERIDGTGYHKGAPAPALSEAARLLAVADAYQAMTEARPHRPAMSPSEAATALASEATSGRLDRTSVEAVLEAAGHAREVVPRTDTSGLTDRELQVLRLIARGKQNKEVAKALTLSPKTVGRHIENIYAKTGISTRAGAALFAMERGLLVE